MLNMKAPVSHACLALNAFAHAAADVVTTAATLLDCAKHSCLGYISTAIPAPPTAATQGPQFKIVNCEL